MVFFSRKVTRFASVHPPYSLPLGWCLEWDSGLCVQKRERPLFWAGCQYRVDFGGAGTLQTALVVTVWVIVYQKTAWIALRMNDDV